ncbi:MAG: ABC transporter substrate-binding protein, partial [Rhodoluna sp.]|nr:ABC transporter substrate-binding protein [Rhodoluna sp.]
MRAKRIVALAVAAVSVISMSVAVAVPSSAATNFCTVTDLKTAGGMDALVAAAKKEGTLNVITLPRDWAN